MKRIFTFSIAIITFLLLLAALFTPRWHFPKELPPTYRNQIRHEIREVLCLLDTVPGDVDIRETALSMTGFSVLDTDNIYPAFLTNPEPVSLFWQEVCSGKDSQFSLWRVTGAETLRHILFLHEEGQTLFFTTEIHCNEKQSVIETTVLPVYDMELTEWDIFYYQVYPAGDPHYVDYGQIRLSPVDRNTYDWNRNYVIPVGYQMVNLFLCDWQEGNWENLSFHDTLEALYTMETGFPLAWQNYPRTGYSSRVWIPAEVFESTILPYFAITQEQLRRSCGYNTAANAYPWRPVHGNDLTAWKYPMCEPEVMSVTENPDGTVTLDIQVYSPELKTDRLFCHKLTIRSLSNGSIQYVANEVSYISDRGLPPNMPRFELDP